MDTSWKESEPDGNLHKFFLFYFIFFSGSYGREKLQFHCICRYENALCMNADVIKTVGTEMQTSF